MKNKVIYLIYVLKNKYMNIHNLSLFIKILNISIILLFDNNFKSELYLDEKEDNNELNKEAYKKEIKHNLFFIKFIISVGIIGGFKLEGDQIGYIIISNILSEIIDAIFYNNSNEVPSNNEKDNEKDNEIEKKD